MPRDRQLEYRRRGKFKRALWVELDVFIQIAIEIKDRLQVPSVGSQRDQSMVRWLPCSSLSHLWVALCGELGTAVLPQFIRQDLRVSIGKSQE